MTRSRLLFIAALLALAAPPSASAAQRTYRIVSGTSTITLDNAWVTELRNAEAQLTAGNGATLAAIDPKASLPVYRLRFPVRKARGNIVAFGAAQGTLMSVVHRGTMTLTSSATGAALSFLQPAAEFVSPEYSPGINRFESRLAGQVAGSGEQPFIRTGKTRIRAPRNGQVKVTARNVRFNYSGAGSEWLSDGVYSAPMGDLSMILRVKPL